VRIDRLQLNGFAIEPGQQHVVRASMETELGRLLTNDLPERLRHDEASPRLPGSTLRMAASSDPTELGRRIARALHQGMQR
jgi:hypothetical protein